MYNGAGDFDDTSFYNPDAGGFSSSQGPMDSYYSTDNKGELIGTGTDQDKGQYTGNAKYLDTPSFHNPDASGFDSEGPRDSYGGNGYDEGGFAGELNELGYGAVEPQFSFSNPVARGHQSDGPRGHSGGLHEDAEDELVHVQKDVAGMDTDQDAPQIGPDNDSKADDGMGMFETITKKELMEKAKDDNNPWAICTSKLGLTGRKKDTYSDKEEKDFEACVMGVKKSTGYQKESINRKMVENWLINLVEKYERPSMSKEQFLRTINEIAVMAEPAPATPKTRPGIKPGTTPGKPDRKSPYKPKHKPNPKAEDADNDIEDAKNELPAWMDFESLFIKNEDE